MYKNSGIIRKTLWQIYLPEEQIVISAYYEKLLEEW